VPYRIVFLSAECEPWAKVGGLADVVDALARALGPAGAGEVEPVEVFLPRYREVELPGTPVTRSSLLVPDPWSSSGSTEVTLIDVEADGYRLRLVDHPPAFDRPAVYGDDAGDYPDNAWRFGLLCRATLEALRADRRRVDVLHLHDWHAAPAAVLRDTTYAADRIVGPAAILHTLHNLAYHGWVPADRLGQLGLARGDGVVAPDAFGIDLLAEGIERADLVNTVSPGYAAEALSPEYGMGLDAALRGRGDRFFGILNGLDTTLWDPSTDRALAAPYSRSDRSGKAVCRRDLLEGLAMDPGDRGPVLAMIGRLDPQKGFDLLADAAPALVERGARLIVLGSGDGRWLDGLRDLAAARPGRVSVLQTFDRTLSRRIYAGADLYLMPSRFEPSGQGQMIAMRYGTPPVVRRTGGLRDSVLDEHLNPGLGTGFAFDHATADGLLWACEQAMAAHAAGGEAWEGLVDRGMRQDFGWAAGAAPRYLEAYRRAVTLRAAAR
jgi:starch synthase